MAINYNSDHLVPIIAVNCSNQGFSELPENLPLHTKIIILDGNEIEDLRPLRENSIYMKVDDLYLDNNKIKSIEALEGSNWLKHFRVFSLRGNKLTEVYLPFLCLEIFSSMKF